MASATLAKGNHHCVKREALLSLQLIVLNNLGGNYTSPNLVYKFFSKLDRSILSLKHDCFKRIDTKELLTVIEVLKVVPKQSTFTDENTEEDVNLIKSKNPGVLM